MSVKNEFGLWFVCRGLKGPLTSHKFTNCFIFKIVSFGWIYVKVKPDIKAKK